MRHVTNDRGRPGHGPGPRPSRFLADAAMDLRYAARTLRRQPGFSLAVALTLSLGLGLNATVLGIVDALLLRPYQFPGYERLVVVWESPRGTDDRQAVAPANYLDWRQGATAVEHLVAWEGRGGTLGRGIEAEPLLGFRVSPGFFEVLGRQPALGRSFLSAEETPGSDGVVVIGDGLWRRRFGADPGVVGSEILIDGAPHLVVGVAPAGFEFPVASEFWTPLAFTPERRTDRTSRFLTVLGRLAPGVSLDTARAEFDLVSRGLATRFPATNMERGVAIRTLSTAFREESGGSFIGILQIGAGLVLFIACANLVGLLLARANDRHREMALRSALGAGRMRIVRQVIAETVLLGLLASALALLFAWMGLELLRVSVPASMAQYVEGWSNLRVDSLVMLVIPLVAIGLGVVVGLIPALAALRLTLADALKAGDRAAVGDRGRQRVRQGLVVAEIALSLALIVAAGLAFNAGLRLVDRPGGFETRDLLTLDIPLPDTAYAEVADRRALADRLLAGLDGVPGIEAVALANVLPAAGWSPSISFAVGDDPDPADRQGAGYRTVSPGYFETMGVPVVSGRAFSAFDRENTEPVAIVSRSIAARLWADRTPVGERMLLGESPSAPVTIVGVVGDVTNYNWWDGADPGTIYVPLRQAPGIEGIAAAVRMRGQPPAMASAVRDAVAAVDPLLTISRVRTMDDAIVEATFGLRLLAWLMAVCGSIALLLALVGIYSAMAYAVSQRTREFGVRMALGASAGDVLRLVLRQAGTLALTGIGLGVVLALVLGRLMSSLLFGLIAIDAGTVAGVAVALAVVAYAAAYLPARRSLRVDPMTVLREL